MLGVGKDLVFMDNSYLSVSGVMYVLARFEMIFRSSVKIFKLM